MTISNQFLDEIRARLPLSELVGRRLRLTRQGREFSGLCPFHNEKTPSFTVNDEKAFFHCFGCGAHGDVVGFLMRMDNLAFPEAVERLAEATGLEMPAVDPEARAKAKVRLSLFNVLEAATAWFEAELSGARGAEARAYLSARGISKATSTRFRLGWAPDSRGAVKSALASKNISEAQLIAAGLVITPEDGGETYNRFRGRLIFPISDPRGRVIAFGGRLLGEGQPKYLNSPKTSVFQKGSVLYGLSLARQAARGTIIITEGYMDVIALHQAGFANAVAPLGTALTEWHMESVWRLVPDPILCLDGDEAGQRAALRAAERALPVLRPGRSLRFASLPPGEDPDSFLTSAGAEKFRGLCDKALTMVDFLWNRQVVGRQLDTPERQAGLKRDLQDLAGRIDDKTVRQFYLRAFNDRIFQCFLRVGSRPGQRSRSGVRPPAETPLGNTLGSGTAGSSAPREKSLMQTLLNFPTLIGEFHEQLTTLELHHAGYAALIKTLLEYNQLWRNPRSDGASGANGIRAEIGDEKMSALIDRLIGDGATYVDRAANPRHADISDSRRHVESMVNNLTEARQGRQELRAAQRAFDNDGNEENWRRLQAAIERHQEASRWPVDAPEYGDVSRKPPA